MFTNYIKKAGLWLFGATMFVIISVIVILACIPTLPFIILAAATTPVRDDLDY